MKDQGKQLIISKSCSRCKGTTQSGAAPLGTAGAPGKLPRGTGQGWAPAAPRPRPDAFPALLTGEGFFLIGPHGDIRAIFKEV